MTDYLVVTKDNKVLIIVNTLAKATHIADALGYDVVTVG